MKKPAARDCYCALCRSPRSLSYERHLSPLHYGQMVLLTATLTWALFPLLQWKTLGSFFIIWAGFELSRKLLYRRDLKCTVCGFDPTWYRRDVRVARKQVETFLKENPDSPVFRARKSGTSAEISP